MPDSFTIAGVHHLVLTVSDVQRSADFYTNHFGFQKAAEFGNRVGLHNGVLLLVLTPPPDPAQAIPEDRFDENRLGLDHVSLQVGSREELEAAAAYFDKQGIEHGEIKDLGEGFAIYVMAVRDPDNIQLELTAPYAGS
jgi:glyoxylase I family protein